MNLPVKIVSTDFDGTVHAEFEDPPIALKLQAILASLQSRGVLWVINTGRDLASLRDALEQAKASIQPDYVVTVEREIHRRVNSHYVGLEDWNCKCSLAHEQVFSQLKRDLPQLVQWIQARFEANLYEDDYSPLCLIARNSQDAESICNHLESYCRQVTELTVVRNDRYARFSHASFNKGSALAEIARQHGVSRELVVAAGDHLNDLPMLSREYARWLIAPGNAVEEVKESGRKQNGWVSDAPCGIGLAEVLEKILEVEKASPRAT